MKKIITYGTFDLFHDGHFNLLRRAKELGDYLVVGVTTAQFDEMRGKLNVVDSLVQRIDNIRKTGFVDEIIIEDHFGQKVEDIIKYGIDVFVVGSDWTGMFDHLCDYCKVVYLERTKDISSTILRAYKYAVLRIGVIGTGRIASRFIFEAKFVSGINVKGVYNPQIERAKAFCGKFDLGLYTASLPELFKQVDAIYIASPHRTHFEYVMRALDAGLHVLCEKPMVLRRDEAQAAYQLADEKKLVLMEGIKTAYCPGFSKLFGVARSGSIGSVRDIEACFTKLVPKTSREWTGEDAGAFYELASYPLFAIAKVMGTNYEDVRFESLCDERGVDYYTKVYFRYKNGFASAKVGIGVKSEGELIISGTDGYIVVKSPWWKTTLFEVRHENPEQNELYHSKFLGEGLRYEINDFLSAVNGLTNARQGITPEESVFIADIMERFRADRH